MSFRLIYTRRNSFVTIQSQQHLPVGRSSVFSLGGTYSSHQQPRARINGGSSYLPANAQDIHFHGSEVRNSGMLATGSRPVNLSNTVSGGGSYDQLMQQYQHF
ncbi:hypothetical protein HanPSC8_Chr05g0191411 [Helianthus annuus]|nr:hypothetical protein HanIR_Chr05g0214081 [Helianthus annuus]KAJ0921431.1 hypothetical protein HanPSC8_Chr05g0191411 [Helianthus annuus]